MRKLFALGVLVAAICLLALFLFFGYLKPDLTGQNNASPASGYIGDVPIGYFDLRGYKELLIDIKGFDFNPRRIIISPGTKIIWRNDDQVFHSVIFDPASAQQDPSLKNSGLLKTGALFTYVFNLPGSYPYHSGDSPETLTGIIIVK